MRQFVQYMAAAAVLQLAFVGDADATEKTISLDKLPKAVSEAVKKMFPKAEMLAATEEQEGGEIEYEVTIKDGGKKIDVLLEANGTIEGFEKELDLKDLPKAVTASLEKHYPKALHKAAEAVYEIEKGKEELEYYEVQLRTADNKEIEAKILEDGTLVPEENPKKAESKK